MIMRMTWDDRDDDGDHANDYDANDDANSCFLVSC